MTDYIAHRHHTLEQHLLGVADKANIFAAKFSLAKQGELIGLLHDLGKYSSEFQAYIGSAIGLINEDEDDFVDAHGLKGKIDHSSAGAQLLWDELSAKGDLEKIIAQVLALCIASHHSGLIDCISGGENGPVEDVFTKRMAKPNEKTHLREAKENMDDAVRRRLQSLLSTQELIGGLRDTMRQIMQVDFIQGVDPSQNTQTQFKIGLLVRAIFSCLIDADRLDTANAEKPKSSKERQNGQYVAWQILIDRLEKRLADFQGKEPIDDIRRDISNHCFESAQRNKGIFTLSVPTGGGKTLASLRFALHHAHRYGMDRVIYIIPYTSIIDQNAEVVRSILEPHGHARGSVVLEHHSNLTPEQQGWREKILSENWDAPIIYTTTVQLLETLFGAGTRGARRMHQLANSILVFDEIQTLPVNTVHMFCNTINFLVEQCGSSVVLCTATQPLLNGVDAAKGALKLSKENEIMPDVEKLFDDLERVKVLNQRKPGGWQPQEIVDLAIREIDDSGSCLVIVNTKKAARTLFGLCKGLPDLAVFHLSTNMCPVHRKNILDKIRVLIAPGSITPIICISTQLIEAGVDVDFGSVIRYTAGLDSIAQAAGRCNRNKRRKIGNVHVVNPVDENLSMLKDIRVGKETAERILADAQSGAEDFNGNILAPKAMERYFEYYFYARKDEMVYPIPSSVAGRDDSLLNLLSVNQQAVAEYGREHGRAPEIYLRQSFMTAAKAFKVIDAPTRGIIVPYGEEGRALIGDLCGAFEVEKQYELLRRAQQFSVNVFPNDFEKLLQQKAVYPIQEGLDIFYLADSRYYNEHFGLNDEPEGTMEVLCV